MGLPVLRYYLGFGSNWNAEPTWTEITSYVRSSPGFTLRRGSSSLVDRPRPAECGFNVNNDDRRFDPSYAAGPYYGQILPMVQVKVEAEPEPGAAQYLDLDGTGDWATSDYTTALTDTMDIRFKVKADAWTGGNDNICAQGANASGMNHAVLIDTSGRLSLKLSTDGTTFNTTHSTAAVTGYLDSDGWLTGRVSYAGVGTGTVIWYYSSDNGSTWTEFGTRATYAPGTPLHSSTQPFQVGVRGSTNPFEGRIAWVEWRATAGSAPVAYPRFNLTSQWAVGDTSADDGQGNTWTLAGDALIVNATVPVFRGFVLEWPQQSIGFRHHEARIRCADGLTLLARRSFSGTYEDVLAGLAPLGWWKLDETSGTTATDSGSAGVNGTYVNTPALNQTGPITGMVAADFEKGSSEHVTVGTLTGSDVAASWTAAWYMNPETVNNTYLDMILEFDTFLAGAQPYGVGVAQGYVWLVYPRNAAWGPAYIYWPTTISTGAWRHCALAFNSSTLGFTLYLDGVSQGEQVPADFDNTVCTGTMSLRIGDAAATDPGGTFFSYDGLLAQVAVFPTALDDSDVAALYGADYNGFASQDTGTRIGAVLDEVGWPAGWRDLDTGRTTLTAYDQTGQTALDAIYDAAQSENGKAYINGSGALVFDNRSARSRATPDHVLGSTIGIRDLDWTIDDQLVASIAGVTGPNGRVQATNTTTLAQIGEVALERTTQTSSATEPTDYANWLVQQWKPRVRFSGLELGFGVSASDEAWDALLGATVGDLIRVIWDHPAGGADIDEAAFIETQTLTVRDNFWTAVYDLSPAAGQRVFILDNSVLGVLDTGGLFGW